MWVVYCNSFVENLVLFPVVIEVFESVNMRQRSHQSSATNLKVGHVRSFIVL